MTMHLHARGSGLMCDAPTAIIFFSLRPIFSGAKYFRSQNSFQSRKKTKMVPSHLHFFVALVAMLIASKHTWAFSIAPLALGRYSGAPNSAIIDQGSTTLGMGLFDAFSKAFENKEYGPPPEKVSAVARHILVPTKEEAQIVMKMIASGEQSFKECAQQFSTCPSASKGGSLGSFGPGTMVKEFDQVVFNPDTQIGQIMGPVLTQFGHHVIVVEKRSGGGDWY